MQTAAVRHAADERRTTDNQSAPQPGAGIFGKDLAKRYLDQFFDHKKENNKQLHVYSQISLP